MCFDDPEDFDEFNPLLTLAVLDFMFHQSDEEDAAIEDYSYAEDDCYIDLEEDDDGE